ncbi:hypothetical protein CVIRNUC_007303 [Coccomyxa viridis]|uniref:Choline kinase n=1 Tax=Coccomyxa viridis TaxID=1274662 RepID=A0AAV1IDM7_9CHLO|nr:hypothetical protein CVIRNUC_007303 [Coccomyxa viridis]
MTIRIDESVDVSVLLEYPAEALHPLLKHLKGWQEVAEEDIEAWQISGAMTNIIFRCQNLSTCQYVLVRIFGTNDALFSRADEQRIFSQVAEVGLGPKLLANFCNGRIEEFLQDQAISAADMQSGPIAFCVASAMAHFHFSPLILSRNGVGPRPILWPRVRAWARSVQQHYTSSELEALQLHNVIQEIDELERSLTANHISLLGFCHNDLQYGNMLLHTTAHRSLSFNSLRSHSIERAVRGGSPPPRAGSLRGFSPPPRGGSPVFARSASPFNVEGMSPRSREHMRVGLKGFAPNELEPRTSEGELVADLLATAGAQFESGSCRSHGSSSGRSARKGGSAALDGAGTGTGAGAGVGCSPPAATAPAGPRPGSSSGDSASSAPHEQQARSNANASEAKTSRELLEHAGRSSKALGAPRLSVRLIDYEYAGPNPVAFDIANHWCEYGADYHTDAPHLLDYSRMPQEHQQERFIRAYLDSALALQHCTGFVASDRTEAALEEAAAQLLQAANAYIPMSHLIWGLWGLLQARTSNVPDFDFTIYAEQRLEQYHRLKRL